jgi:hypothetical protein
MYDYTRKISRGRVGSRRLARGTQELIAEEMLARVSDLSQTQMSASQRRELKRRLSQPRVHVPDVEVQALFQNYNAGL